MNIKIKFKSDQLLVIMLSRLASSVAKTSCTQRVTVRSISTDLHYQNTIPRPVCLHAEAKKIANRLATTSADYTKAYETAMNILQTEIEKARYKAIAGAKQAIRNASESKS